VIYFDFDKSEIKTEGFRRVVLLYARNFEPSSTCPLARVQPATIAAPLIHIGSRTARTALRRALMLQGVSQSQLTTVSFGRERPRSKRR